jgi:hypothetical protein
MAEDASFLYRQYRVNRYLWAAIALLLLFDAAMLLHRGWQVHVPALGHLALILLA